jgi:integrase/recombinase XerD
MSDAGVFLWHIKAVSGHKTLAVLKRYLGVTEQQKETAISTLDF